MDVSVKGLNFNVGDALTEHIEASIATLTEKYQINTHDAEIRLEKEPHGFYACEIVLHLGRNTTLAASDTLGEPYASFDSAAEKVGKRMRRYKRRLRDHHRRPDGEVISAPTFVIDTTSQVDDSDDDGAEGSEQPLIIAEMATPIESLTVSEAVMKLELADAPVLTFRNSAHGGVNVIYRRTDGNISWVDPKGNEERR